MNFCRRETGTVSGGRVRRVRTFAFLISAVIFALLPSFASAQVTHVQTFTADSASPPSVSSLSVTNVTSGTDQLYIAAIAYYGDGSVVSLNSVSGGGLTWSLQKKQCSRRLNRAFVEVWQAFGSPGASFNVDITLSGNAVVSAAVSRYSGADPTTPTEGADGSNTGGQGVNAVCDGFDEETTNLSLSLTSSNNDSVLFVASHPRNKSITTADADYTQRAAILNSDGGNGAYLYVHERTLATAGTDSADHTIGSVTGWDMAGLVINPAPSNNLIGHWNFNEGTGQTVGDSSTSNNDGTRGFTASANTDDPAWACSGTALDFDGSDDEVKLGSTSIGDKAAWSISAWIKTPGDASKLTIYSEGNTAQTEYLFLYVGDSENFIKFYSEEFGASNFAQLAGTTNVEDDAWHHVVVVQRSKTDRELYVDNTSEDTSVQNAGTLNFNTASIGYLRTDWVTDSFKGIIDDVRIYDYALSTSEIAAIYASPPAACGATPAVTSAVAEISPTNVTTSSTGNSFSYDIQATIGGSDTGVDQVNITVPGTFSISATPVTDVLVDDVSVAFTDNTSGSTITVDLGTKVTTSSKITVLFQADAPTAADATGKDFTSTVDDTGTGDAAQATTEGDGDGEPGDNNSWTVTTTDGAGGGSGGGACPAPGAGGWYPGGWLYRKPLSIGAGNVGSDLTDFPVLVSIASDTDLAADAQADFDDILFTAADGTTKLSHEIEQYNETTGELVAWVKVPTVSSSVDTVFYMYYGNASATNQQDPTGVWSNGYAGVWHMKEDPSGTAPQMGDSTSNNLDGTTVGTMNSADQVAGQVAGALDLDGADDYIDSLDHDILGAISVSAWVYWNAVSSNNEGIVSKRTSSENLGNWAFRFNGGLLEWMVWDGVDSSDKLYSASAPTAGQWAYVVATFDDSINTARIYLDGALENSSTGFTKNLADTPEIIKIGQHGQGSVTLNGRIDEVRLSSAVRSADWITAEYINQVDHDNFQALCGEETESAGGDPGDGVVNSTGNASDNNTADDVCDTGGTITGGAAECTLRAAIQQANATAGANAITFNIPTTDAGYTASPLSYTIVPGSALPTITEVVDIDGSTQPDFPGTPIIVLDGNDLAASGLTLSGTADGSTIRGLIIRDFGTNGILLQAGSDSHTIAGNYIGSLTASGTDAGALEQNASRGIEIYGSSSTVGGTVAADRNVISGNGGEGIIIRSGASGNIVRGNYIGLAANGTTALGNQQEGIQILGGAAGTIIGGSAAGAGNVIGANGIASGAAISLEGDGTDNTVVQGNYIGTDSGGTVDLGNIRSGVEVRGTGSAATSPLNTLIGGTGAGEGNVIRFNDLDGVRIRDVAVDVHILGNSIYDSGSIDIDLWPASTNDNVTENDSGDADSGSNDLLNFPVITSAVDNSGTINVDFDLDVPVGDYRIEFFKNPSGAHSSGNGGGEAFASAVTISHTGSGAESFSHSFAGSEGNIITATATEESAGPVYGSTSEFSDAFTVTAPPAVTSADAEISPNDVATSSTANAFSYDIQATISGTDTGVNRVAITVPGTFGVNANPVTDVLVNDVSVAFTDNTVGNAISVDLTAKVTTSSKITVLFDADAPTAEDTTGVNFTSTVEDSATGTAAQATTEGNGDGDSGDANSWTVTTTDAGGPTTNYRSIGTNAGILYSTGTASINVGTSTVSFGGGASLPVPTATGAVGQGDKLIIGAETFYILSRDSATQVTVQETAASTHTDEAYTIERAYNTPQDWETAREGNLVAEDRHEVGVAYADGDFTGPTTEIVRVMGSTTDASHYMELIVAQGQQHDGTAGTGVTFDGADTTKHGVRIVDSYTRVRGLEMKRFRSTNGAAGIFIDSGAANVLLEDLLIYDFETATESVAGIHSGSGSVSFTARNCIIYDGDSAGIRGDLNVTGTIENCTIHGMASYGIWEDSGTFTVTNTIAMGSSTDFNVVNGTQSYNLSSDASAAGTGSLTNKVATNQFASLTAGSEDLHLKAGSDAIDAGTDLSGSFTDDIDGDARPIGAAWEIGADESSGGPSSSNLIAHWKLDEGSGQTAADSSATNNDGTLGTSASSDSADPAWACVAGGNALDFDGSNDEVQLGSTTINDRAEWTLSAWIKMSADTGDQRTIYSEGDTAQTEYLFMYVDDSTNTARFYSEDNPGTNFAQLQGTSNVEDDTWHLITVVQRSKTDRELYVDGVSEDTDTNNAGTYAFNTSSIGYLRTDWVVDPFLGKIDDVRIYDYALSAGEIAFLAASPPVDCGDPAATSALAEISPNNVLTNSTGNSFTYDIQVTIGGSDTGVNRVAITVPGTFGAPTVTGVQVDGSGVAYGDNTTGNAINVDLTSKVTSSSKITVLFDADAPTSQDLTGVDFTSTVDDTSTGNSPQATTEGDGDGDSGDNNSWTVTTTDVVGGDCPAPNLVFSEDFESGNLSAWDVVSTGTGDTIAASTVQANAGSYSVRAEVDSVSDNRARVMKDFTGETTIAARVYIYLDPAWSTTDNVEVLYFIGPAQILATHIKADLTVNLWNQVASEGYDTSTTITKGAWHVIEMQAVINGTSSEARLWVDGALATEQTGINLGTDPVTRVSTGWHWSGVMTEPNILYIDNVVVCDVPMGANDPAVTSALAEISPNDVSTSSTANAFSYDIQATIGAGDTGVNRVGVTVPAGFSNVSVTDVQVDGIPVTFIDFTVGNAISVDLATRVTTTSRITVLFDADAPVTQDLTGVDFLSTVEDSGTGYAAQNTTEGNGDADAGDTNSWTVTTTDAPDAVTSAAAEISPNDVTTSSTANAFSYDIQVTIGGADTGVDKVTITVPGTFGAPTVTAVQVDGSGVAYADNTSGNDISIDLTSKVTSSSKITILFDADAPTTQDLVGVNFTSTVDDSATGQAAQSTTQGNGDGDAGDLNSWVVTTTDPAVFSCPIGSSLFNDDFEAGNLGAWDGSSAETGDSVSVSTDQANGGTYSLKGLVDTVTDAQAMVWKNISGQTEIHAKVEMFLPTSFSISDHMTFLQFLNNWSNVLALTIDEDLDFYMWNAVAAEAYGFGTTPTVTKNAWHTWEMRATISDTVGEARVWLDGNLEITATNINLGTNPVDRVSTGYYWSNPRTEANVIYVDDVELCGTPTPAVTSAVAEISPNDVTTNSTGNSFSYDIAVTIGGGDTGVDRVAITVPVNFGAPTVTDVLVDDVSVAFADNTVGNALSVDLTTKVTASSKITVLFDADAPTSEDLTGSNFLSTVDDSGTGDAAQSTTEGNGDGDAGDLNSWTVTTTDAGGACIAVDGTASTGNTETSSLQISHTTSGTDRLMLVGISIDNNNNETVSSVTYNGTGLTLVGSDFLSNDARIEIWQLTENGGLATGTHNVDITFSADLARPAVAGVMTFTGVHQTTPLGTFASATGTSTAPSVTVSSGADELVYAVLSAEDTSSVATDAPATEHWNLSVVGGGNTEWGAGATDDGAASVDMSWTMGSADYWAVGGVPIKPSGTCGNGAVTSAVAEISPNDVTANSTGNAFSYDIQATISGGDTGVDTVAITVPGSFGVPTVTDVLVDGFSVAYTDNTSGNAISVVLTTKVTATSRITVLFSADAPIAQDPTGVDFVSTVDDSGSGDPAQATTEGNGDGDSGDNNSWTVTTTGSAGGAVDPVVNSTGDAGDASAGDGVCDTGGLNSQSATECTLRAAIQEANANTGLDTITFNMPTTEPGYSGTPLSYTTTPATALPSVTDQTVIDGTTQPGYSGTPIVVLDGNNLGASGLTLGSAADNSTIRGLVIRDFGSNGIQIQTGSDGNVIAGNYIGRLNVSGTDAGAGEGNTSRGIEVLGSTTTIGGTVAADRNVISGNGGEGIIIRNGAADTIIRGNYLGVAADGTTALGNDDEGIQIDGGSAGTIIGGSAAGAENVIGANGISSGAAISISEDGTDNTVVQGNYIGTDTTGTVDLGNINSGIDVRGNGSAATSPLNTLIGGTGTDEGNIIRFNGRDGVRLRNSAVDVAILGNSIDNNDQIGIDLWPSNTDDGVTANDSGDGDSGSNYLTNFPVITSAIANAGSVDVDFDLDVPAGNYRVEFFKNPSGADPSGNGEGETYINHVNVTHGGTGVESFSHSFSGVAGDTITATATEELSGPTFRNTSEFSASYVVTTGAAVSAAVAEISPNDVATSGGTYSFEYDIAATIGAANTGVDRVAITVPGTFGVSASPVVNVLVDGVSVVFTDNTIGNAISVDLASKVTSNARITVLFEADAPTAEDLTGVDFTSTVDDSTTGDAAQAATEGNGDGDTEDNNSWTVTTTGSPPGGGGACTITVDGVVDTGTTIGTSVTISHTTSGTERLMLVGVSLVNGSLEEVINPDGITYNGTSLTRIGAINNQQSGGDDGRVEIWALTAPDTGTHNVVVNFTEDLVVGAVVGVMTFNGVDQTTPLGPFAGNEQDGATSSVTVTSAADELVFAVMGAETTGLPTANAPATERWSLSVGNTYAGGATSDGASPNVTVSFSHGSDHWAAAGVSIKPSQNCGTAVDTALAEISPNNVTTSSTGNSFAYDIQANITASDTGVDRIGITVPASFTMGTVSDVLVNGVSVSYTNNTVGNDISIDLASKLTSSARITVLFTADAPTSEDLTGDDFLSTVDDSASPLAPQATTEGDGDGDAGDNNDWTVTTTDGGGACTVEIDGVVDTGTTIGSSMTISHTTSGSDRLMLVGVSINNDSFEEVVNPGGITYNGVALTRVGAVDHQGSGGDDSRIEIWSLVAPDTGTHDVSINFTADLQREAVAGVMTFTGVDQTTPLGTFASNYGDGATSSVTVSSAVDELVFGIMSGETTGAVSADAPATQRWTLNEGNEYGAGATSDGASPNVTISFSHGSDHWAAGGVSIKPASSCAGGPGIDHFAIIHDGTGINCQAENITIEAHNSSHAVDTAFAGTISLSTSTLHGDWSLVTGSGSLTNGAKGNAVYGFSGADSGAVVLGLRDTFVETTNIDINSMGMTEDATEDDDIVFARSGFNFLADSAKNTIGVQIGGKPSNVAPGDQTLELQAVKTNDDTGACEAALVGPTTIDIGFECEDPAFCATNSLTFNGVSVPANANNAVPTYARVSMDFGSSADSTATFTMTYDDVGKVKLHARSRLLPSGEEMIGGSNSFVVRPFAFDVQAIGNPAATGPGGNVFTSAGTNFSADVTALLWQAGDDIDNDGIADNHDDTDPSNNADLTDNAAALNYGKEYSIEQVLLTAALDQPSGGANPGLSGGTSLTIFTDGTGSTTTLRYDEVGIIEIAAKVSDNDYLGIGAAETGKITSKSGYVGRFNPAQYEVTASDINPACSATFTYARQPFTGSMTIEAQNGDDGGNTRTQNYRAGFVTLDPATELTFINSQTAGAYDSKTVTYNQNFDSGNTGEAILALQFRWDMPEQAPAISTVQNTAVTDEVTTLVSAPVTIGSSPTRHGRAFIGTAAGSELVDLDVVMRTEYYLNSTSGYVINADDFCSIGATLSIGNFTDNLNLGETCVQDTGNPGLSGAGCALAGPVLEQYDDPLIAGDANLWLKAPGAGNDGSATVDADVPAWLEFDWDTGVPGLEDPTGHITFGIYGGDKNQIYRRELY